MKFLQKEYQCTIEGIKQAYETFYKVINADQPKSDVISQVSIYTKHAFLK